MGDQYVLPGLAAIAGGKVCRVPAVMKGGGRFFTYVGGLHVALLLGFYHVDCIARFRDEIGIILSRIVAPIYPELPCRRPQPLEDLLVLFQDHGKVFLGLGVEFIEVVAGFSEAGEDSGGDGVGGNYGLRIMVDGVRPVFGEIMFFDSRKGLYYRRLKNR